MVTIAADSEATIDQRVKDAFFIVEPNQKQLVEVAKLLDAGKLQTFVKATVPLNEASIAYSGALKDKRGHGKIVIAVTPPDQVSDSKAKPFGQQEFLTSLAPLIYAGLSLSRFFQPWPTGSAFGGSPARSTSAGVTGRVSWPTLRRSTVSSAAVVPELAIVATVAGSMISSGIPRHLMSSVPWPMAVPTHPQPLPTIQIPCLGSIRCPKWTTYGLRPTSSAGQQRARPCDRVSTRASEGAN